MKKKLVIIAGVTGAIGMALLEQYGSLKNTVVLGISRQALPWSDFVSYQTGRLHASTLICSLPEISEDGCEEFISAINFEKFSEVTYLHCIGKYLFEINQKGQFTVVDDQDDDGINDECFLLSYSFFRWMTEPLLLRFKNRLNCGIFGSLADKHRPQIIQSWWKTMLLVEEYMKSRANEKVGMAIFIISSVLCPHEILTRPYVFVNTEAESRAWLSPYRLATAVRQTLRKVNGGFHKVEVFTSWQGFFPGFYEDQNMVPRRLAETEKR